MTRVGGLVLLALFVATPSFAQLCSGNPSFRDGPYQAGVGASFTDGIRTVGGTFAAGGESLFGGAGVSAVNYTGLDVRTAGVSAFVGSEFAADSRNRVLVCPVASLAFLAGPDTGPVDRSSATVQAGGNVGVIATQSGDTMVVPYFGLALLYQRVRTEIGGAESSASDTGAIADIGVGFIFNRMVGITPSLSIPFSAGASDAIFSIRFSFNFGS